VCLEETLHGVLEPLSCRRRAKREMAPYQDIFHFTGDRKPWWSNQTKLEQDLQQYEVNPHSKLNFRQLWYLHLKTALTEIDMADQVLSQNFLGREETPPVGRSSSMEQMKKYIGAKQNALPHQLH
jgi:lipopolysaccharide biosynthesis glycosyltransferase